MSVIKGDFLYLVVKNAYCILLMDLLNSYLNQYDSGVRMIGVLASIRGVFGNIAPIMPDARRMEVFLMEKWQQKMKKMNFTDEDIYYVKQALKQKYPEDFVNLLLDIKNKVYSTYNENFEEMWDEYSVFFHSIGCKKNENYEIFLHFKTTFDYFGQDLGRLINVAWVFRSRSTLNKMLLKQLELIQQERNRLD